MKFLIVSTCLSFLLLSGCVRKKTSEDAIILSKNDIVCKVVSQDIKEFRTRHEAIQTTTEHCIFVRETSKYVDTRDISKKEKLREALQ